MAGPWEKYQTGQPQPVIRAQPRPQLPIDEEKTRSDIEAQQQRLQMERERIRLANQAGAIAANANSRADMLASRSADASKFNKDVKNRPLEDRLTAISNLESIHKDLLNQYNKNFKGQPIERGFGLTEMLPGKVMGMTVNPTNKVFNSTALRAGPFIQSILGLGSKDADAAAEYERKVMPFLPEAGDPDADIASKIRMMGEFIKRQRESTYRQLGRPMPRSSAPKRTLRDAAGSNTINFDDWND